MLDVREVPMGTEVEVLDDETGRWERAVVTPGRHVKWRGAEWVFPLRSVRRVGARGVPGCGCPECVDAAAERGSA